MSFPAASFPAAGGAIPAAVAGSNISFSKLRTSWDNAGAFNGGSDPSDGSGENLRISNFHGATLPDGTSIDADGSPAVSIGTHFCGKTFLVPVGSVLLAIKTTTPDESTNVVDFATATVVPAVSNGTLTYDFSTASGGAGANPATAGFQADNTMDYTFDATGGSNQSIGTITVSVKQNGGSVIATRTSSVITIKETGGGGGRR